MRSNEMPAYLCQPEPGLLAAGCCQGTGSVDLAAFLLHSYWQETEHFPQILRNITKLTWYSRRNNQYPLDSFVWVSLLLLCALFYSNPDLLTCPLGAGSEAQGFQWHFIIWVYSTLISARVFFSLHCFFLPHWCLESSCCSSVGNGLSCGPASKAYVKSDTISGVQILWWLLESWEMWVWVSIYQQRQLVSSSLTALVMSQLTPHPQHTCLLMSRWVRRASPWTPAATWCHQTWPEEVRAGHSCTSSGKLELTPQ